MDAAKDWLEAGDRESPVLDELQGGDSIWPMLCCALCQPWWLVAKSAGRVGLLNPQVVMPIAIILYIATLFSGAIMESQNLVAVGISLQVIYIIAVNGGTLWMRRTLRAKLALPGSAVHDAMLSVWPFNVWSLAVLDRQLTKLAPQPQGASPPAEGAWATGLCGCVDNYGEGCPVFQCSASCGWFTQTRIFVRLGERLLGSPFSTATALFLIWAGEIMFSVISGALAQPAARAVCSLASVVCFLTSTFLIYNLRQRVRARFAIAGSPSEDALSACFCAPCALTQMERQTLVLAGSPGLREAFRPSAELPPSPPPGSYSSEQQYGSSPAPTPMMMTAAAPHVPGGMAGGPAMPPATYAYPGAPPSAAAHPGAPPAAAHPGAPPAYSGASPAYSSAPPAAPPATMPPALV